MTTGLLRDLTEEEAEVIWPDTSVIAKAAEKLPDGYRVVFSLYLLEGYDHAEISQIMNISESTSKTQYLRAKEQTEENSHKHAERWMSSRNILRMAGKGWIFMILTPAYGAGLKRSSPVVRGI